MRWLSPVRWMARMRRKPGNTLKTFVNLVNNAFVYSARQITVA